MTTKPKSARGGARTGSGAPTLPAEQHKRRRVIYLDPVIDTYLQGQANSDADAGIRDELERIVRVYQETSSVV